MDDWRRRLEARRAEGLPVALRTGDVPVAAADLWRAVDAWADAFRAAGLVPGDRLVVALPSGPQAAVVVLAALADELTLAPAAPTADVAASAVTFDARAAVVVDAPGDVDWAFRLRPAGVVAPAALRPAGPPTPDVRLLAPAASVPSWVALSDANLAHAVDALLGALRPTDARWLSVLPWWRSDGVVLDLLPAVLGAPEVLRTPGDDPSVEELAALLEDRRPTHTVLTAELATQLVRHWGGPGALALLHDGIVSGPVDPAVGEVLSRTRLRTHRGAPELSHLVTLGEPGAWRPGALGRPVGCVLEDDLGGTKAIRGVNLCYGTWDEGALTVEDPDRAWRVRFG